MIGTPLNNNTMAREKKRKRRNSNPKKLNKQPVVLCRDTERLCREVAIKFGDNILKEGEGDIIQEIKKGTEKALKHFNLKRDTHIGTPLNNNTMARGKRGKEAILIPRN